jgi:DNA-binding MarR family transcriptional regulator
MTIQEEIKQSEFANEYQKLIINQLFTGRWVGEKVSHHLKPFGLSSQQYNVLRILRGQEKNGISVNAITERMIDKMSNVSRLIDKLNVKGFINRTTNSADRRQVDIEISESGLELLKQIDLVENELNSSFNNLTIHEAKHLNDLLDKLRG